MGDLDSILSKIVDGLGSRHNGSDGYTWNIISQFASQQRVFGIYPHSKILLVRREFGVPFRREVIRIITPEDSKFEWILSDEGQEVRQERQTPLRVSRRVYAGSDMLVALYSNPIYREVLESALVPGRLADHIDILKVPGYSMKMPRTNTREIYN